jgi:hypothetical protein
MYHTAEIDMATSVAPSDIALFLTNVAWAICSTYHTVFKTSPGTAIFGRDMYWNNTGDYRQCQTDLNTKCGNNS